MQNIIIFGASGHGGAVLDCVLKQGKYNVIGFVDSYKKKGSTVYGYQVLGSEFDLPYLISKYSLHGGIVAIGDNWIRKLIVNRILKVNPKFSFVNAIHPNSTIATSVFIGCGNVFMAGAVVGANSVIHDFCIVNTNSSIDHDGIMQSFASIAPNACLGGNVFVGSFSAVCLGANIVANITIGEHSLVGAGALVLHNVEDQVISYGTPAEKIRNRMIGEPYLSSMIKRKKTIPLKYS